MGYHFYWVRFSFFLFVLMFELWWWKSFDSRIVEVVNRNVDILSKLMKRSKPVSPSPWFNLMPHETMNEHEKKGCCFFFYGLIVPWFPSLFQSPSTANNVSPSGCNHHSFWPTRAASLAFCKASRPHKSQLSAPHSNISCVNRCLLYVYTRIVFSIYIYIFHWIAYPFLMRFRSWW